MGDILGSLKTHALPCAIVIAVCLFAGLIGPGQSTPAFLKPTPKV